MWVTVGRRLALLSVPLGYASLLSEQGQPVPLANDLQLFSFRWQSLFKIGWQWTLTNTKKACSPPQCADLHCNDQAD